MPRQKKAPKPASSSHPVGDVSTGDTGGPETVSLPEPAHPSSVPATQEEIRPETEESSQADASGLKEGGKAELVTPQKRTDRASLDKLSPQEAVGRKSPGAVPRTKIAIKKETEIIYRLIRKSSGALGGNGYTGAIYGELTMHSMQRVIDFLVAECEFKSSSRFLDIGSGLGKPNFHVAQDPGVRLSIGVELEEIRWQLAMHNLQTALKHTTNDEIKVDNKRSVFGYTNFIVSICM